MRVFFLLFISIPILEMWILIEVGARLGAVPTIALVFVTAAVGLALLRRQGMDTLFRANKKIETGELPASEILTGLMLAIGGALLLTPGFITDVFGFICLLPFTRQWLVTSLLKRGVIMASHTDSGSYSMNFNQFSSERPTTASNDHGYRVESLGETIDGDFKKE